LRSRRGGNGQSRARWPHGSEGEAGGEAQEEAAVELGGVRGLDIPLVTCMQVQNAPARNRQRRAGGAPK